MRASMAALALAAFALAPGCIDTRGPCQVFCDNQIRCGFMTDEDRCASTCASSAAMASADCRTQSDRYERCWSARNTCPTSPGGTVAGCESESADRALACSGI